MLGLNNIQIIGNQLFSLIDDDHRKKVVLDFSNVEPGHPTWGPFTRAWVAIPPDSETNGTSAPTAGRAVATATP